MSQGKFQVSRGEGGSVDVWNPFMGRVDPGDVKAASSGTEKGKAKMSLEQLKTQVKEAGK
jgi:hypothetical protein